MDEEAEQAGASLLEQGAQRGDGDRPLLGMRWSRAGLLPVAPGDSPLGLRAAASSRVGAAGGSGASNASACSRRASAVSRASSTSGEARQRRQALGHPAPQLGGVEHLGG